MPGHGDTPVSAIAPLCPQRHHDARLVPAEARPCTRMLRNLKITNCRPLNPLRHAALNNTAIWRKRLRTIAHTVGFGGWWFWPRRHRQLVS
jgi:hypothetical protein